MMSGVTAKHIFFILLGFLLITYFAYQGRFLIVGPTIGFESHRDGQVVSEPILILTGRARNVARLELNGRQIFTNEDGLWSEKLILREGLSIMTLIGKDRFGREKTKGLRIFLKETQNYEENQEREEVGGKGGEDGE